MKGEAVEQIPPLATLGRDDRKPAGCGRDDMVAALGRDDRDGRSFGSGLRPTLRMTEAGATGMAKLRARSEHRSPPSS